MTPITFTVLGIAQPKGSTKAFMRPGMRFPVVTADNTKTKPWAQTITAVAQRHAPSGGPWAVAVSLEATFYLPRPKSLPKKVQHHTKKPDLDKLLRALKDALKGVMYVDDSQVVETRTWKAYARADAPPGVRVTIAPLDEGGAA